MAKKNKPLTGQIIPGGGKSVPVRSTPKARTIDRLLSKLSIWPFRNRAFVKALETATEVIEKQDKLEETIIRHQRRRGELMDLGVTLQRDRDQRNREFLEERKRLNDAIVQHETLQQQNQIYKNNQAFELKNEYELQLRELEYKKRLLVLEKEVADLESDKRAQPKKKTVKSRVAEEMKKAAEIEEALHKEEQKLAGSGLPDEVVAQLRKKLRILGEEIKEGVERVMWERDETP